MRSTGADQLVGAMKPSNAGGAKGLGCSAETTGQLEMGGARGGGTAAGESYRRSDTKSRMKREFHVRFRESAGVRFPRATRPV